jgi:hypothetical protein
VKKFKPQYHQKKKKKKKICQMLVPVTHAYNLSYSGDRDEEDPF